METMGSSDPGLSDEVDNACPSEILEGPASLNHSRHLAIEVRVCPPSNPGEYAKVDLPPSRFVSRVLEEINTGTHDDGDDDDDAWFSVEFDDGRVERVSGIALHPDISLHTLSAPKKSWAPSFFLIFRVWFAYQYSLLPFFLSGLELSSTITQSSFTKPILPFYLPW